MPRFSANLGFLWTDRPLPDAIRAARQAGFAAVELHWPYDVPAAEVKSALDETALPCLSLNTRRGMVAAGEMGLASLPDRREDARTHIEEAVAYAQAIGAHAIHILAGFAKGEEAEACFQENLTYGCDLAAAAGKTILIEPLNHYDAPQYFLQHTTQARALIEAVGSPHLKLMFDCYHIQILQGDVGRTLQDCLEDIGHIQIASVPDRGPPDHGELSYDHIFSLLDRLGYDKPIGAEYKVGASPTEDTLSWLQPYRGR